MPCPSPPFAVKPSGQMGRMFGPWVVGSRVQQRETGPSNLHLAEQRLIAVRHDG